jgi:hypothetical protein
MRISHTRKDQGPPPVRYGEIPKPLPQKIKDLRAEVMDWIDGLAAKQKAENGDYVPLESIRQMLMLTDCPCSAALRLLDKEKEG